MNTIKQVALTTGAFALVVVALVVAASATKPEQVSYKPVGCQQQLSEYRGVAAIATATGHYPGVIKSLPVGTKLTADPNFCKAK